MCLWEVDRIALGTRAWFPVAAAAELTGFSAGHALPGGGATSTAAATAMLRKARIAETQDIVTAYGAAAILQMATTFSLPVLALPAILGGAAVNHSLVMAAYLGVAVLVTILAVGTAVFVSDKPVERAGHAVQWLLNATVRRRKHVTDVPQKLLADRDFVRTTVGKRWKATLLAAAGNSRASTTSRCSPPFTPSEPTRTRRSSFSHTSPGELLALLPFTPGGLGFVEAGLVTTLTLAGVPGGDALAATLLYRIVSYWLPLLAGGVAYLLFRQRYGSGNARS